MVDTIYYLKMTVRKGSSLRVVKASNCLPGKIVAGETVNRFILESHRYLEALKIEGYRDIDRTCR